MSIELITTLFKLPEFAPQTAWDPATFVRAHSRITQIIAQTISNETDPVSATAIEIIHAGFYRNRRSYLVGRIVLSNGQLLPLILALLNSENGIYVDAIISNAADAHNLFSSTLANFHVTDNRYHELCDFLHSIMPARPLGLHYSTIGYNHFGKLAVINELRDELSLPAFLQSASDVDAQTVINNLGFCIKNNAAANIFNKDLDARNYGVSRFLKVYLYDYDALEPLKDVKLFANLGREDGEDDVPDWYFEDGVVFLPEEIEAGLMLENREDRRTFRHLHGDLLNLSWWQAVQQDLSMGYVPAIRVYPEYHELERSDEHA